MARGLRYPLRVIRHIRRRASLLFCDSEALSPRFGGSPAGDQPAALLVAGSAIGVIGGSGIPLHRERRSCRPRDERPRPVRLLEPHRTHRPPLATRSDTGCPAPATGRSTAPCTSWPPCSCAPDRRTRLLRPQKGIWQDVQGSPPRAETPGCPTSSTAACSTTQYARRRAREDTGERLPTPA